MALLQFDNWDFKDDLEHFETLYNMEYEEFINTHKQNNITIDLTNKIVVSIRACSDKNLPIDILTIFIPEEIKNKYKSTLIYAGHIAFIKFEYNNGLIKYSYKDDECYPVDMDELLNSGDDVVYCCEEKGFKNSDIELQIEKFIQATFDYNYKFDKNNIIILQGL